MDHEGATYKTVRDEIAIEVIKILMKTPVDQLRTKTKESTCRLAYEWADAMIAARENQC